MSPCPQHLPSQKGETGLRGEGPQSQQMWQPSDIEVCLRLPNVAPGYSIPHEEISAETIFFPLMLDQPSLEGCSPLSLFLQVQPLQVRPRLPQRLERHLHCLEGKQRELLLEQ